MKESRPPAPQNKLLAQLPAATSRQITRRCDVIDLHVGDTLSTSTKPFLHVYFPMSGLASLVAVDRGIRVSVGTVGNEGMIGVPLVLGVSTALQTATVRCGGTAWRMPVTTFHDVLSESDIVRKRLNLYVYLCMSQLAQTAACTRYHALDARLARSLSVARDRLYSDSFSLTHESLANMLGVRRAGVTDAASSLRERGLIRYSRGAINVINRVGLARSACACYARNNQSYAQIMGR